MLSFLRYSVVSPTCYRPPPHVQARCTLELSRLGGARRQTSRPRQGAQDDERSCRGRFFSRAPIKHRHREGRGDNLQSKTSLQDSRGLPRRLLTRARFQFIFDTENANVRAAAVDLLSASILQRMKAGGDVSADFAMLRDRSVDASLSVRLSVLSVS